MDFPWSKTIPGENGCILWTGCISKGYGQIGRGGKTFKAHRYSYEANVGPITNGLHVMHSCDVKNCVNPQHLSLGTHADNMADMKRKGRGLGKSSGKKGTQNLSSKLTDADVLFMRSAYLGGVLQQQIADAYQINQGTVSAIVNGKRWKHLTEAA